MKPDQRIFVGVVDPIDPRVETPEEVRDRVLEAAEVHPARATGHHRRLRVLALLRRHLDQPRHGVREDSCAGTGDRAGMEYNFRSIRHGDVKHDLTMEYGSGVRMPITTKPGNDRA